jgi:predicted DNA-binding transcriptional regulator
VDDVTWGDVVEDAAVVCATNVLVSAGMVDEVVAAGWVSCVHPQDNINKTRDKIASFFILE